MTRIVIAADDVLGVEPGGHLLVPPGALVTPLARDVARERSVTFTTKAPASTPRPEDALEQRIRSIVATMLLPGAVPGRHPVKLAQARSVTLEPFGHPGPSPDQQVRVKDVITSDDGSPMAAGYMSLTAGSFSWDFGYDEVQIVLEGELHLGGDGGDRIGHPGDIFYIPKGSHITFGTPSWTKFVYVTFPADWEGQS
ncbi:cupin domain-containing protein [Tessaracoccus antarcticus]|uniref:DUF861 domain-containing protein n=1 Tax=Tessaracoccus antarcticus TaxID=2479848 RepID=A0A3M0GQP2_9ACTN|nr:cupin domain-containing protein [Tessaracoccus antarcticus]RMB59606.1 DUF861 domain-containing protein [Tessaracoccus antarcticus]